MQPWQPQHGVGELWRAEATGTDARGQPQGQHKYLSHSLHLCPGTSKVFETSFLCGLKIPIRMQTDIKIKKTYVIRSWIAIATIANCCAEHTRTSIKCSYRYDCQLSVRLAVGVQHCYVKILQGFFCLVGCLEDRKILAKETRTIKTGSGSGIRN